MFVDTYALSEHFTRPLVVSTRRLSGALESAVATWVLLNADGWFLTAGHVFERWRDFELHLPEVRAHRAAEAAIAADPSLDAEGKRAALERLAGTADPAWIENCSAWWGTDGLAFREVSVIGELDLALGRLEPVRLLAGPYPTFKNPEVGFRPGRSLCRFGFAFEQLGVRFDPARPVFSLDKPGLTLFPIEGILTRLISQAPGALPLFIETSSAGRCAMPRGGSGASRAGPPASPSASTRPSPRTAGRSRSTSSSISGGLSTCGRSSRPSGLAASPWRCRPTRNRALHGVDPRAAVRPIRSIARVVAVLMFGGNPRDYVIGALDLGLTRGPRWPA